MAKRLKHTAASGGRAVTIYGDTTTIRRYFPNAQVIDEDDYTIKSVTYRGGVRRRFPGGPGVSYGGGTRSVVVGPPARRSVLPGNPIKCEEETGVGPLRRLEINQMSLVGSITAAVAVARATATRSFVLRSPGGKPYQINAAPGGS